MADNNDKTLAGITRRDFLIASTGAALAAGFGGAAALAQDAPSPATPPSAPPSSAPPGKVIVERQGAVLLIGLDRPQAQNRLDAPMIIGISKAYYQLEHDDELRVAVLYATGRDFCPGLDVPAYVAARASGLLPPKGADVINPLGFGTAIRSKPVVVAVQGATKQVGHELFLAADFRVAASDTTFRQAEVIAGAFPGGGATVRFPREAGWGNAMRYMLTGEEWGAEESYRIGLTQAVTPPGKQLERAIEWAKKVAANAPLGVRATLTSSHQALAAEETTALAAVQVEFGRVLQSQDAKEGQQALREGRAPIFRGL